ncbi:hypothetical protein TNCV_413061 [Trichonephila clavipes]|nr:hypothetical protein TNCV_413061 [Trichonephila clavipes]
MTISEGLCLLNLDQVMRVTPEPSSTSPKYFNTPRDDFEPRQVYRASASLHEGSSVTLRIKLMINRPRAPDHDNSVTTSLFL